MYQKSILIALISLFFVTSGYCFSKEEVLSNIHKRSTIKYCPFIVTLNSKVVMGTNKQDDSGSIYYSPTGCTRVEMYKTQTAYSTCDDTSWYKMPNGDITRAINKPDVFGFSKNQATMPDFSIVISKYSSKIIETLGDSALTFEILMPIDEKDTQKVRLTFDCKQWLLRKISIFGGQMGETVASYVYTQFHGQSMLKSVNMVMGSSGFMVLSYSDYKEIKDNKKTFFRMY
jgi:hypothetical protein